MDRINNGQNSMELAINKEKNREISIPGCDITELLIENNHVRLSQFSRWIFCRGMLFKSHVKWWGDRGLRAQPHEGLDLCFYMNQGSQCRLIDNAILIPACYSGLVVNIARDFMGSSIFFLTEISGGIFCWAYGHLNPNSDIVTGKMINKGDIVGRLAEKWRPGAPPPHLHLSIGIPFADISSGLDWNVFGDERSFYLMDPLLFMGSDYSIISDGFLWI